MSDSSPSDTVVGVLVVLLVGLILLLIFLYKKLNREADGQYTIRRMVYKEGGVRDRVRGAALAVETFTGIQLWPRGDANEDGEEMQEIQDEEGQVEGDGSQGSDTEGEDEQEEDDMGNGGQTKSEGGHSSSHNSSLEISEADEQARLMDGPNSKEEMEKKGEEKQEKVGEEQNKQETSGGAGLLIDLKNFSGSAIWSGEEGGEGKGGDVTAL
ncbi:retrotransposon-like protein 1 [Acanthochromis polyacanthus]|uniref:retrotransposon-like protein 1 n=1 Tax=Acanthochromis polyacanthus TaxID=80966 RepID=UPI0022349F98|nr:retrotransposon-like protein 1 [Acanthochromis polyacanthus]XP_051799666.1 retrotransposon-like protein 1 [Acanthochromis polyacanthus]